MVIELLYLQLVILVGYYQKKKMQSCPWALRKYAQPQTGQKFLLGRYTYENSNTIRDSRTWNTPLVNSSKR